ncbi:MAG: hypothetical protein QOI24_1344 [Acidobacteriota bacterium]|jgi:hypothetical protein|nr:hypothetical protein [Acidobacteriota bacterium]
MKRRKDDRHDRTRDALARAALRLVGLVAVAIVLILAFEKPLGLSRETEKVLLSLFVANLSLAAVAFRFYFPKE